jgi:DUF4097 and DUF4098 domain-containing protein YvlB
MTAQSLPRSACATALAGAVAVGLGACTLNISNQAQAKDEWHRHYELSRGGTFEIHNTNGVIHLDAGDIDGVDVTAERIVQAASDDIAKDALAKFEIVEKKTPDHVMLDSSNRAAGLLINLTRKVNYTVHVPTWANIVLDASNGDILVSGSHVTGKVQIEATNGRITASGLEGATKVETTNGEISLTANKLADDGVSCTTTNGAIFLTLPADVPATLSARVTNGTIQTGGLNVVVSEQSRRRLDGTLHGGGPPITLETTNGLIQLKAAK